MEDRVLLLLLFFSFFKGVPFRTEFIPFDTGTLQTPLRIWYFAPFPHFLSPLLGEEKLVHVFKILDWCLTSHEGRKHGIETREEGALTLSLL